MYFTRYSSPNPEESSTFEGYLASVSKKADQWTSFKNYLDSTSESSPEISAEMSDMSSSPQLIPFDNMHLPRRHSGGLSPMPRSLSPIIEPQTVLETSIQGLELQANDQPQPMAGIAVVLSPGNSSPDGAMFSIDFGCLLTGPSDALTTSEDTTRSVFGDVVGQIEFSIDEQRFSAQKSYTQNADANVTKSSRKLKRSLPEDHSNSKRTKMLKVKAAGRVEGIQNSSSSFSEDSYFYAPTKRHNAKDEESRALYFTEKPNPASNLFELVPTPDSAPASTIPGQNDVTYLSPGQVPTLSSWAKDRMMDDSTSDSVPQSHLTVNSGGRDSNLHNHLSISPEMGSVRAFTTDAPPEFRNLAAILGEYGESPFAASASSGSYNGETTTSSRQVPEMSSQVREFLSNQDLLNRALEFKEDSRRAWMHVPSTQTQPSVSHNSVISMENKADACAQPARKRRYSQNRTNEF